MRIPSGVTDQYIYFIALDATDFVTPETGLSSFTVYRSRNGGTATAYTTPTITEVSSTNMPGWYKLLLDEDMTIDSGDDSQEVALHITATGMAPARRVFELYRPKATAGETLAVSSGALGSASVDAILDQAAGVETNRTLRQALRLMLSVLVGKASGLATTTAVFRDTNDSKDRVTATVDANGNRSSVTLDGS